MSLTIVAFKTQGKGRDSYQQINILKLNELDNIS